MDAQSSCLAASSAKDGRLLFPFSPHAAGGAAQGINPGCAALQGKDFPWGLRVVTMVTGLGQPRGASVPLGLAEVSADASRL